jgi:hypothetical protein
VGPPEDDTEHELLEHGISPSLKVKKKKAYKESGDTAPLILNLGMRRRRVINFMP